MWSWKIWIWQMKDSVLTNASQRDNHNVESFEQSCSGVTEESQQLLH